MNKKQQKGYVLLLSVLVIGAIVTATTTSILLLGLGSDRSSFAHEQSEKARELANSCAREAVEQLSRDNTYAAGVSIPFSDGSCTINAISGTGDTNRTVQASGLVGSVIRKVQVEISDLAAPVDIISWQDVADF